MKKKCFITTSLFTRFLTTFGMTKGNLSRSLLLTFLRSYVLMVLLMLSCCVVYGQLSTAEKPVSFTRFIPAMSVNEQTHKVMPPLDMAKIEQEDKEEAENGIMHRFGIKHEVSYNLTNSGEWIDLPDGDKLWRLSIFCPNATSINLLYDKFCLPEGAQFFLYSNDKQQQLGAFTSRSNKGEKENPREFSTALIYSNHIILEYYLPNNAEDMGVISVSDVVHGYRGFGDIRWPGMCFNCSYEYYENANCYPSLNNEINSVVLIIVNGNSGYTGSLVNTTANEMNDKHYILTVEKCNGSNYAFYWHYEHYACTPNQPINQPPLIYTHGATVVASSKNGNFLLLRLNDDPGLAWDVVPYYLGWDRTGTAPTGSKRIIHHPSCDIKKITSTTTRIFSWPGYPDIWETEDRPFSNYFHPITPFLGSEGAPLLNSNSKLIGHYLKQTNGECYEIYGIKVCYNDAIFGKFSWAWTNNNTSNPSERLRDWLDPINTGNLTCEGRGCQDTIKLWKSNPKSAYHAVHKIISKQVIPNGTTTSYKAGAEIKLIEGFHAKSGSNFHAKIEELTECITLPRANTSSQNDEQNDEFAFQEGKSLSVLSQISYEFNLLPNPNSGTFQIETNFPVSHISNLKVINTLGITVYETQHLVSNEIQLQNSCTGLYFVLVTLNDGKMLTQKMMVHTN